MTEEIKKLIIYTRKMKKREPLYRDYPEEFREEIRGYLESNHISRLYAHQVEMFEKVRAGENVVITTSTASGKTLAFLLPVLQEILEDPLTRAIFIYPTKALASDQYRAMQSILKFFGEGRVSAGVYDGDTKPAERTRIRKSANIILTNPEMLNSAFLPNHSNYGFDAIFANLRYVVIDELHSYRGAFGAHLANIFRRMHRICRYYHSNPHFLCSSATIANPVELAEKICGSGFTLIDRDGSPAPEKEYCIIQPPEIKGNNDKVYGRIAASTVAAGLIPELVEEDHHFITFGRSRRNVEVILKEAKDKLDAAGFLGMARVGGKNPADLIAGYRGGYTPLERKEIERKMTEGELTGLVSTNALELGIDIGKLDATVIVGYPGTRASFWQQSGRAGRSGSACVNYLILENEPFDQYIAIDPEWLFSRESENAIVDPDNLLIELAHLRAAAAEMPLSLDDIVLFPDLGEMIPVLLSAGEVKSLAGRFAWAGPAFPAGDYSLRNMDKTRFKLLAQEDGHEITEMDESQAYHEIHPGAVYMHDGASYEITKMDLVSRTAYAIPFTGDYYTVPAGQEETRILHVFQEDAYQRTEIRFGDINVNEIIAMYKKLQFHNHQNLGYVTLTQPLQKDYGTESTWLTMPENVVRVYRSLLLPNRMGEMVLNNHFDGMQYAIKNAVMMVTMTERDDIDVTMSNNATIPDEFREEKVSLFIYDKYEGGLGYSEKIYDLIPEILESAIKMVSGCPCEDGCPACVGDYNLDKKTVLWGLDNLLEESEPPVYLKKNIKEPQPVIRKEFSFFNLPDEWEKVCYAVVKNGEAGGQFLKTIKKVSTEGHKLILTMENEFYAKWLMEPDNLQSLTNTLRYHVICPADMQIRVRYEAKMDEQEKKERQKKRDRLQRRYDEQLGNE